MRVPALYDGQLLHVRREPVTRMFRSRIYLWLVDLDDLPSLPWWARPLARFRAEDHLGRADRSIRSNVDDWLAGHDVDLTGGRILMLASARVLGYVFNPLTVFWCHRADGELACVIAEVCNTYGERHCYLVSAAEAVTMVDKRFYVSPFLKVGGRYRMRLPVPGERLSLSISLVDHGRTLFSAVLTGRRKSAGPSSVLGMALTRPLMPHRVSIAIRLHGIRLWLSGLPVTPRAAGSTSKESP
ncbi:DUF1365 domain-containing protein [Phytomonospora sp. NPDC050363]|uniref:DUF1365 domain-containing protein n=1 Tax=Phytomonospora sp. NPDC050363 TaxID=3155642 RepID=UPI0033E48BFB